MPGQHETHNAQDHETYLFSDEVSEYNGWDFQTVLHRREDYSQKQLPAFSHHAIQFR